MLVTFTPVTMLDVYRITGLASIFPVDTKFATVPQ